MARQTFFSFHYKPDNWRASQVRNIGAVEGSATVSDNDWEKIVGRGDAAIQEWIDGQLKGRSCSIVLIGAGTAGRKWINYEIKKSWNEKKGLVGIYIHHLKNADGAQSAKGNNPFSTFTVNDVKLSTVVKAYDPPYEDSQKAYSYIKTNLSGWVEEAVKIRTDYKPPR